MTVWVQAEQLIQEAQEIAESFHHDYLGVEHVFLGAIRLDLFKEVFDSANLDGRSVEEALRKLIIPGEKREKSQKSIPRTPRLKKVLHRAAEMALERFHRELLSSHILESILREFNGLVPLALEKEGSSVQQLSAVFHNPSAQAVSERKSPEKKKGKTALLDRLGRNLTKLAGEGKLDEVIGRTEELRRVMQILGRKKKNVPILIGAPGVGKTAVVFALAHRLAKGNVPPSLRGKRVIELPLGSLVAGTAHRGELEERIQKIVQEASQDPDCIVFIDEIHGLIGAGNVKGSLDVANLLKPALADGSIRVIGATTTEEYQKYLVKDQALERRLQPVLVSEPSEPETEKILMGLKGHYEKHHGVKFEEAVIRQAIKLSLRYLPERRLPDKALDLLDEAASHVKMKTGADPVPWVKSENIAEVISLWTGIPVSKVSQDEREKLLHLESFLKEKIVGQDEAVEKISETIRISRAGLGNPKRPMGVFLFLGPTGVGKTALAKTLAQVCYGSEDSMIRLDMSEFKEQHSVAKLIGSPPGYVGYEEEGQLTKAVHARPYSLILLDEVEKAHPEVLDLFLQIFEDGRLTDSKGRTAHFSDTLIVMTSNLGSQKILSFAGEKEKMKEVVQKEVETHFRPEFLNRMDEILIFNPLTVENLEKIVSLQLDEIRSRLREQNIELSATPGLILFLKEKGYHPAFGARPLRRTIQRLVARPLAEALLEGKFSKGGKITADVEESRVVFQGEESL